ncbi:thioredoxin family protein [Legionella jamestowniensis]|uniref:Thioredoxin n=1 Tax=Legionella jamestowniensis TaxID=455 RepID=A0A0W0UUE5_9GAMM|nr:thioredoxin family protein [Legionella jamestowniensis]KTD11399.1 thioredoxin [Legionella jamestowniensis]OCH98745.1 thiol reductase thioredoxin [Legionella jamestowniensis]SFL67909.1 thioredoxin [Legionella jamestowniensis DSM 19215]
MPLHELKTKEFENFIEKNPLVFIDFWAEWCAPCKEFARVYQVVAEQYPTVQFAKLNIEDEPELAEVFQIRSIPHLMVFKEGIAIYSEAGSMPESVLKDLIEQAINVDVSEIRAQINQEEK